MKVDDLIGHNAFHAFVRWGLGIHGTIHIAETAANVYEGAWISAGLSLLAGFLMIAGACIDLSHHGEHDESG
tara:strand:+ start:185 stop:400 length:216 start_codon:yes stop_codon:yes gene_type:complete